MKRKIYNTLEEVIEPSLGIDIVNLGLVYEVCIKEDNDVQIVMTTTSGDSFLAEVIAKEVKRILKQKLTILRNIDINIVTSPRWSADKMTRYAWYALELQPLQN
ncbi:metal-sulfur cluster assembly factor [Mesobacillus harenae]|uniref:metal-sulfur cluster assembly factor n=1 Tax=Mesobacillus harenae TaxID=2213203 RepID=UPI0018D6AC0D|nr:metal-sulfur cluster assembly factor [Mesobacillus harenae]